jgi:hypothetical protein
MMPAPCGATSRNDVSLSDADEGDRLGRPLGRLSPTPDAVKPLG